jgi:hypothetical protein
MSAIDTTTSPPNTLFWTGTNAFTTGNTLTIPPAVQRDRVQTFNDTWLEFRKMFGPLLLDNSPLVKKFNMRYGFLEYTQPEIELELTWIPKKIQRRMF